MEPGSCGFFAYVNPPRSPVVLEDTPLLLLWSLSGPGHGQLMHNSAEFWMIILYGTVYFFWPFISSCALSLPPSSRSLSLFRLLLFCSFHYFYTVSSCLRSKWFRVDGDAKIIIKCSSRVQGPVEANRGGTCHVLLLLPCALSIEPKTSDIRPTTHDCPAPLQVTPVSPFLYSQQIETNPHPFVESGNASFDFILCAQSGQQKTNKKKEVNKKIKNKFYLFSSVRNWIKCSYNVSRKGTFLYCFSAHGGNFRFDFGMKITSLWRKGETVQF